MFLAGLRDLIIYFENATLLQTIILEEFRKVIYIFTRNGGCCIGTFLFRVGFKTTGVVYKNDAYLYLISY